MIKINTPAELKKYFDLPDEAIKFMNDLTPATENGRYTFSPDCYVNVMNCDTKEDLTANMEAHDNFVDVQYVIEGEEKIVYANREGLTLATPYNPDKDVLFFVGVPGEVVCNKAGEAAVLYPAEAHLPGRAVNAPMTIKKAVMKVRYKA